MPSLLCISLFLIIILNYLLRVAAAYLGALSATETSCVTQPFQTENCSRAPAMN